MKYSMFFSRYPTVHADTADSAAARHDSPVRQQHGRRMILPDAARAREHRPLTRRGIPAFRSRRGMVQVNEVRGRRAGHAAGRQHRTVGEQGRVELPPPGRQGSGRCDGRDQSGTAVHDDGGSGGDVRDTALGDVAAADDDGLADVVRGEAAVVPENAVARAGCRDYTVSRGVDGVPGGVRAEEPELGVRTRAHEGIEPRAVLREAGERAKGAVRLVHLGGRGASADDDLLAVCRFRHRGIPARGGHVIAAGPRFGPPVEDVRLDRAVKLRVGVSTGDQDVAVRRDARNPRRRCWSPAGRPACTCHRRDSRPSHA